jgi:thiosulfate dehydrogenase
MSIGDGTVGGAGSQGYLSASAGGCGDSSCHNDDGSQNAGNEHSIGDVAVDNPWEFLHKVRYGQPGTFMPSGIEDSKLTLQQMADILAFAQVQLPQQNPGGGSAIEGDFIRGGLLYDNWPAVLTAEGSTAAQPVATMPLFALRADTVGNTRSGLGTWRCKECHGWDYKGADGVYAAGSHFTGFPGVIGARNDVGATESFLLNFLKNGYTVSGVTYHNFMPYMTEADLIQLVSFIKEGVLDTDRYISTIPAGAGKGDLDNGRFLYIFSITDVNSTLGCSRCHALNGKGIDFDSDPIAEEFLKDLALGNPWEVLHKIRFGEPHSIGIPNLEMPSALRNGFTNVDAADIMTYSQNLPQ